MAWVLTPLRTAIGRGETGRDANHWMRQGGLWRLLRSHEGFLVKIAVKTLIHKPEREN